MKLPKTLLPNTPESDELYDETDSLGFYIYAPQSRNQEVADLLGIPFVYCVAICRKTGRAIVQMSRGTDSRTAKLPYAEVRPDLAPKVLEIMKRKYTIEEREAARREDDANMERARRGLL